MFGLRYELDDFEFIVFLKIYNGIWKMFVSGSVVDVFFWLRFFLFKFILDFKDWCKEWDELFGRIYREYVEVNRIDDFWDLIDVLLKVKKEVEEEDFFIKGFLID